MARIRTLKPDFWSDGKMVKLSPYARLLYIGMWNFALCDNGHLPDDPDDLKLKILPADPVDAGELLAELVVAGRVKRRRTSEGQVFLVVPTLINHQKTDPRWKPRCPYCGVDSSEVPAEPHRNSREFERDSASLTETPGNSLELPGESKGREGKGITAPTVLPASPAGASVTQRSKAITDAYAAVVPMCRWPAINGIVIRAIKAERYADTEIRSALLRLADEGRSVTVETLRVEIEGLAPRASPNGHKPSTSDMRVLQARQAGEAVEAMLEGRSA